MIFIFNLKTVSVWIEKLVVKYATDLSSHDHKVYFLFHHALSIMLWLGAVSVLPLLQDRGDGAPAI